MKTWALGVAALIVCGLTLDSARADITFGGVGITIGRVNPDRVKVSSLLASGPAERAGVLVGEFLRAVDSTPIQGMDLADVTDLVRGQIGTEVILTLEDEAVTTSRDVKIVREEIVLPCLLQGMYRLILTGSFTSGTLSGSIGSKNIQWPVSGGRILTALDGHPVNLEVKEFDFGSQEITGFINGTYVIFQGQNGKFNGGVACVP